MRPPPHVALALLLCLMSGCAGQFAESSEFVYGPLPGSEAQVFDTLTQAIAARGYVVLESDPQAGRVVVAIRAVRGDNGASQAVFQCYRGGFVRATVAGAEHIEGAAHRIRMRRGVRDGYEEIAVGLLGAASSGAEVSAQVSP